MRKSNIAQSIIIFLVILVVLMPRIPILPLGFGELSIRIDGVTSALIGLLALYVLRVKLTLIPLFVLGFLYAQNFNFFAISMGLFLQVLSIFTLPILFFHFGKKNFALSMVILQRAEAMVVWYALINVTIAIVSRNISLEICADSLTNTGCIGAYGLLDRPYVFSIFIGCGFIFLCSSSFFSFLKTSILLYGLLISDSRSIAAIMFVLGIVVYLKQQKISLGRTVSLGLMVAILLISVSLGDGKMSLTTAQINEVDPSWLIRLNSIEQYMGWVDISKFIFGDGALAFYQFSEQYGQPGPMDNLYFRVASEIGVAGSFVLLLIYLYPLFRSAKRYGNLFLFGVYVVAVSVISIFQESLITPRAGHVLVMLGIYLVHRNAAQFQDGSVRFFGECK